MAILRIMGLLFQSVTLVLRPVLPSGMGTGEVDTRAISASGVQEVQPMTGARISLRGCLTGSLVVVCLACAGALVFALFHVMIARLLEFLAAR